MGTISLVCWLPLISDFHNQGTDNVATITGTSISFVTGGKIGNCCKLGYSSNFTIPSLVNAKQISIAYWLKINTATSTQWLDPIHYFTNSGSSDWTTRQELYSNCTLTGFWFDNGSISGISTTVGEWMHFAITVDYTAGVAKVYKNGILVGTSTAVNTSTKITGANFRIGESGLDLCENDVRIYNHILSAREVAEIAKGMIVHYPLSFPGNPNLTLRALKSNTPTSYEACKIAFSENLVKGNTYTVQFWDVNVSHTGKSASDLGVFIYWGGGSVSLTNWKGTNYFTNGHADYLKATFTAPNSTHADTNNLWFNIYNSVPNASGTMNLTIGRWKLEKGDKATPWCPNTSDTAWSSMGFNNAIEYDVSGYSYNGTKTGTFSYSTDTAKYSASSVFSGSNYIDAPSPSGTTRTVSFWLKTDKTGYKVCWADYKSCLAFGIVSAGDILCSCRSNSYKFPSSVITANVWQHIVIVRNDAFTTVDLYVNGVKQAPSSNADNWTHQTDTLTISGRGYTSNPCRMACQISDFRLYSTVFTADQVKELYNTPLTLTNNGRLLAQGEYVEI